MTSPPEHLPPQDRELERAVLGAMFVDPQALARAIELLDATCFYHAPHRTIFQAMLRLWDRTAAGDRSSSGVDPLTLTEELRRTDRLDQVGGLVYLTALASGVATGANLSYHAGLLTEKALRRRLIETAAQIADQAYAGRLNAYELVDWAHQQVFALAQERLRQGFEPLEGLLPGLLDQIVQAHNRTSGLSGVTTGFPALDEITSGFQPGDLIILAARPSVGKSALALAIARHLTVDHNVGVGMINLEMSRTQVAQRLLSAQTRLDLHRLRIGRLSQEDWGHLKRTAERLAQAPLYLDEAAGITILEARARARRLRNRHHIGLVIIDYLQLMGSDESPGNREQEIAGISRGLKALAKELQVPVLALSQLSRAVESRPDRRPQLSDLRESGSLEQDADVVLFIYRQPESNRLKAADDPSQEGRVEIIVAKQRNGPTGSVHLAWNASCASFENLEP